MTKTKSTTTEIQVGKEITDKARSSKGFYTTNTDDSGRDVFYFRHIGDWIKGRLASCRTVEHHFYSSTHYIIQTWQACQGSQTIDIGQDETREIVAYRDLRRIIEKCELMGSIIRIVMIGRIRTGNGHFRFVWQVFKDTGTAKEREIEQIPKRKKRKGAKL